jgi:hypothetical protein
MLISHLLHASYMSAHFILPDLATLVFRGEEYCMCCEAPPHADVAQFV